MEEQQPGDPTPEATREVSPPPERVKSDNRLQPKRRWPKVLTIIIALILIGTAAYLLFGHPKKTPSPANSSSQNATKVAPNIPTISYSSSNFALSFDYPQKWTVTDNGGGQMQVKSPVTKLKSAAGDQVDGQIVMTIANKGQNLSVFDKGNATAVMDSQKISYTKPAQTQRANTYISFLQYFSTTQTGALDGIYITGDYGYQKTQDVLKTDVGNIDPLVTVTFIKCASSDCPAGTAKGLSIASSSWSDTTLSAPILKMLRSLAFQ